MNIRNFFRRLFQRDLYKNYVSSIDKFLWEFDKRHPDRSASQVNEIKKHAHIARLRDNPNPEEISSKIWKDF